jgi:diguanylate cyclase (GGDEF)-like protein
MSFIMWPTRLGLQVRAALLLAVSILALIGADAAGIWSTRQQTIAAAHAEATNLAASLANDVAGVFRTMDTMLVGLRERVRNDGVGPAELERLARLFKQRAAALPMLHNLSILDSDGVLLVSAEGVPKTVKDMSRSATFVHHRDSTSRDMFVSPPSRSVLDGSWVIIMSRRMDRLDGSFGGVVLTSVAISYFEDLFGGFDVGRKGVILLAGLEGFMVARSPSAPKYMGSDMSQGNLFKVIAHVKSVGSFEGISPIDGTRRLSSFHKVPGTTELIMVGRSKYEVLDGWRKTAYLHLLVLSVLTALIYFLGRHLTNGLAENDRSALLLHETIEQLGQSKDALVRARDASETANKALANANRTLDAMAHQDVLTGLANRRHFDAALELEFRRAKRNSSSLALILIDVDYFKKFNDLYGHLAGDVCLRTIGEALRSFTKRAGESACRYGGEEMAILLPGSSEHQAIEMAERIAQAVRDLDLTHAGSSLGYVTISAGVTGFSISNTGGPSGLIAQADEALYAAKNKGRDRTVGYGALPLPIVGIVTAEST